MKIALPVSEGRLCMHFGHCDSFMVFDVDENSKTITGKTELPAPPHQPGLLPRWLAGHNVNCIIAGGMGSRAQGLFAENRIRVITGASPDDPENTVKKFLAGSLVTGANVCDH